MRIGTISLNINAPDFNYGAMLHSWAFQQFLNDLDFVEHTEIIDYKMRKLEQWSRNKPVLGSIRTGHPKQALRFVKTLRPYKKRLKEFDSFIQNNLQISNRQYIESTLEQASLEYDTIICESDVIWAPRKGPLDRSFFLALDSMKHMKRIAYAPSLADAQFRDEQLSELKELLKYPQYISCRESYGAEFLSDILNKPVPHVLDPVLLLKPERYDAITAPPVTEQKYLLLYLPVDNNDSLREHSKAYAKEHGLSIMEITTKLKPMDDQSVTTFPTSGIEEFLSLVRNAEIIFTNSFHAICFAVLFRKQFFAFTRKFQGKVKDICDTFDLSEYFFTDDALKDLPLIDYDKTQKLLDEKRKQSVAWLLNALND